MPDAVAINAPRSSAFLIYRVPLTLIIVTTFAAGSTTYFIFSLPVPIPSNILVLLPSLLYSAIHQSQTLLLLTSLIYFGRTLDPPPAQHEARSNFPMWAMKQPYAGIFIGIFIFISPLLVVIGLSGIAYLIASGVVLYFTPKLLNNSVYGTAALLILSAVGGFFLSMLLPYSLSPEECKYDKNLQLRSGEKMMCESFIFLPEVEGLIVDQAQTSFFLSLTDLTPSSTKVLGRGPWLWHNALAD